MRRSLGGLRLATIVGWQDLLPHHHCGAAPGGFSHAGTGVSLKTLASSEALFTSSSRSAWRTSSSL